MKSPEHINSISPYIPGKPIEELERELGISGSVKLASNENPVGPSPLAVNAMRRCVKGLNRYPDGTCYYLNNALSSKLGIRPGEILFGNGSNEIIELAVRTFLRPGDEAIMASPSFIVYSMIVQAAGGKNIIVPLKQWRHDLDEMASRITKKTRMIFIANPNNPTGTINSSAEMDSFMKKVPDNVLVVIDEAYYEYVDSKDYPDSMKYLKQGREVLILRTFSKIYGLSGLRIGYGMAPAETISEMNKIRQPFNVNTPAQHAAIAALEDDKHLAKTKLVNEQGKKYLYKNLSSLGIEHIPTEANFIYMLLKNRAADLSSRLLNEGVIVRPMGPDAIRVTIGLPGENKKFISAMKKVL